MFPPRIFTLCIGNSSRVRLPKMGGGAERASLLCAHPGFVLLKRILYSETGEFVERSAHFAHAMVYNARGRLHLTVRVSRNNWFQSGTR